MILYMKDYDMMLRVRGLQVRINPLFSKLSILQRILHNLLITFDIVY